MISIIVPAHNEADVIGSALRSMTAGSLPGELEVVVVCNGCTDNTANEARRNGGPVRVLETEVANKAHAINLGDQAAGLNFPRIYVDADVVVSLHTLRGLAARLNKGDVLFVAPVADIDTSRCSWPVRWYYEIASLLPAASEGGGGCGVYAMCHAGRSRFGDFPSNVRSDDGFVRFLFEANECAVIPTLSSKVYPPARTKDLIRVRTRVRLGHLELARILPGAWRKRSKNNGKAILVCSRRLTAWPKLLTYCLITIVARIGGRIHFWNNVRVWERDQDSRWHARVDSHSRTVRLSATQVPTSSSGET
jgi:glycosyltransferase involved in cell wall biosynthesis